MPVFIQIHHPDITKLHLVLMGLQTYSPWMFYRRYRRFLSVARGAMRYFLVFLNRHTVMKNRYSHIFLQLSRIVETGGAKSISWFIAVEAGTCLHTGECDRWPHHSIPGNHNRPVSVPNSAQNTLLPVPDHASGKTVSKLEMETALKFTTCFYGAKIGVCLQNARREM